jgi:hypothetical protein
MTRPRRTARIHLLVAQDAPVVVVLRRKPTRTFHVLRWNTRTDAIEPGSWFRGRLYEKRCDVSPDGAWMIYFAAGSDSGSTWTGLAHPPWLKAIAWHAGTGAWLGGGYWRDARTLCVTAYPGWAAPDLQHGAQAKLPFSVERHDWRRDAGDLEVLTHRFDRDWVFDAAQSAPATPVGRSGNWSTRGVTWSWTRRPSDRHPTLRVHGPLDAATGFAFTLDEDPALLTDADWADYDALGQLVFARAGVLYRCALADLRAGRITQSIDLEPLQPPARTPGGGDGLLQSAASRRSTRRR